MDFSGKKLDFEPRQFENCRGEDTNFGRKRHFFADLSRCVNRP